MAEKEEAGDGADGAEGGEPKKKLAGKKLILLIVLPLLLLLIGGGAGAYFFIFKKKPAAEGAEAEPKKDVKKILAFMDLPEILINLQGGGRQQSFIKLKLAIEYDEAETKIALDQKLPRVIDSFQTYLRELRSDDLSGSAGLQRLKEELLYRVNAAIYPQKIKDVLFKEMLVQ